MGRTDRDLVAALRAGLAAIDPARACDRAAESDGLAGSRADRNSIVARLLVRLRRADAHDRAAQPGTVDQGDLAKPVFDWAAAAEHCRLAWLRGRFLARGSLSVAGGRTHLEFVVDPGESPNLHRAVDAAGRQLAAINLLEATGRLSTQPYAIRLVADARRETPEATLSELAGRLGLHRSAVQRALERIEETSDRW